jgi:hypothetical protein
MAPEVDGCCVVERILHRGIFALHVDRGVGRQRHARGRDRRIRVAHQRQYLSARDLLRRAAVIDGKLLRAARA